MPELIREISRRRCPKCKVEGSLRYQQAAAMVTCQSCGGTYIDPFEEGPWDIENTILDRLNERVVSSYKIKREEGVDNTLNQNMLDFLRYLRDKGEMSESLQGE